MLVARSELAAASVNGRIYAIGGYNAGYLSSVEEYAPESDTWRFRAPMPTPRANIVAAVVGQTVYVFGGFDGTYLGTVEVYDSAADSWSPRTQPS
jgi:N-acetylneuraminic acid mutarotase